MTFGHFVWTDLSTYDMPAARSDYQAFFYWRFTGDSSYDFAMLNSREVAAVFPIPKALAKIDMPSFWMSYVHVKDLDASVAKARQHAGVIIEVEPQSFGDTGRVALVRDPSGAGFTLYEGPELVQSSSVSGRFHHVASISLIEAFYADLFGWSFALKSEQPWPVYDILHPDGSVVAQVEEVPERIRGKFSYWMPCFGVGSAKQTAARVKQQGGTVLSELPEFRLMLADQQGAHFMICADEAGQTDIVKTDNESASTQHFAWRSLLALACVWLAVFLDISAFWGVLFLIWTWPALRSGRTDFVEPIFRSENPRIFWALIATWILLSAWLIGETVYRVLML